MQKQIRFTAEELLKREEAARLAFKRYLPFVVSWAREPSQLFSIELPLEVPVSDLQLWADREGVTFSLSQDGKPNAIQLHLFHLEPEEIMDGIARLGRAIAKYMEASYSFTEAGHFFQGP